MTGNQPAYVTSCVRERRLWITEVTMRYEEFRDRLQDALREAGLIQFGGICPTGQMTTCLAPTLYDRRLRRINFKSKMSKIAHYLNGS